MKQDIADVQNGLTVDVEVVWNVEDEEGSSESPVEDRDKTITTMWDAVTQTKEFGFAVGQDDY